MTRTLPEDQYQMNDDGILTNVFADIHECTGCFEEMTPVHLCGMCDQCDDCCDCDDMVGV